MVTLDFSTDLESIMRTSFNPAQQLVAWTCEPHLTQVYSTQTGEILHAFNGHMNGAKVVKFTPDGSRLITGVSGDDAFKFWELREDRPLQLLTLKVDAMFWSDIRFSPDGNSMSSVDQLGTIHIWRAPSWEEIEAMDAVVND
jgi:WD40 repeat protein